MAEQCLTPSQPGGLLALLGMMEGSKLVIWRTAHWSTSPIDYSFDGPTNAIAWLMLRNQPRDIHPLRSSFGVAGVLV